MKLPKLPAQWEALDELAKNRIEEASEQAAAFLVYAGYHSPQYLDENGDEIGDAAQSLLMDAMLRAPHLYLHISKLNELTRYQPLEGLLVAAEVRAGDAEVEHASEGMTRPL